MNFDVISTPISVPANSVIYLGHVRINNKEKKHENDQATGAAIPIIDQMVAGFSGGTPELIITDEFEKDIAQLKTEYPQMANLQVENRTIKEIRVRPRMGSGGADKVFTLKSK